MIVEAVELSYYDSPRGCTLTELAAAFDVNKSAASGIPHRAEGRIIKEFVASSVPDKGPNSEPEYPVRGILDL